MAIMEMSFESRKRDHIRLALEAEHQAEGLGGFEKIHLHHDALPEINFDDTSLKIASLGREFSTPFYVAGMTAGHEAAVQINFTLAQGCAKRGWAMGVGSQRKHFEGEWKRIREEFPELTLFSNIGLSQLIDAKVSEISKMVESIRASALVIHLNALQEVIQPEGTPQFRGGIQAIKHICAEIDVPVIVKETGCGFSEKTLEKLVGSGIAAIDVSGLGGTHWGRIEGSRATLNSLQAHAAKTFALWGESTVSSVIRAKKILGSHIEIWGSGGVRSGLDAAKLIALGANRVGYAKPALEAVLEGAENFSRWMELQEFELKTALFCTGCRTPQELTTGETAWTASEI